MSNRNRLTVHQAILAAMDAGLAEMTRDASPLAAAHLCRARQQLRAADASIAAALRQPVDVMVIDIVPTSVATPAAGAVQ